MSISSFLFHIPALIFFFCFSLLTSLLILSKMNLVTMSSPSSMSYLISIRFEQETYIISTQKITLTVFTLKPSELLALETIVPCNQIAI